LKFEFFLLQIVKACASVGHTCVQLNAPDVYFLPEMPWITTTLLHTPLFFNESMYVLKCQSDFTKKDGKPCISKDAIETVSSFSFCFSGINKFPMI